MKTKKFREIDWNKVVTLKRFYALVILYSFFTNMGDVKKGFYEGWNSMKTEAHYSQP
jgi:hypothetical protein